MTSSQGIKLGQFKEAGEYISLYKDLKAYIHIEGAHVDLFGDMFFTEHQHGIIRYTPWPVHLAVVDSGFW